MTTSPADPREGAGTGGRALKLLAVTACPTGIAHTYMAAEKLSQAAESLGHAMKVETQGSIGAENVLSDNDVRDADGIIIAADKDVDPARFVGKRLLVVGVAEGIRHPEELIERVRSAPVYGADGDGGATGYEGGDGYAGGAAGSAPGVRLPPVRTGPVRAGRVRMAPVPGGAVPGEADRAARSVRAGPPGGARSAASRTRR